MINLKITSYNPKLVCLQLFWIILYFSTHFKQSWDKACPLVTRQPSNCSITTWNKHILSSLPSPSIHMTCTLDTNQSISQNLTSKYPG